MADEVEAVLRSGKTMKVGDVTWVIVDDGVPVVVPSLFIEGRHHDGIVYLSLAQTVVDANASPEAVVCTRLRMGLGFAQMLRAQLDDLISQMLKPADKSQAN